MSDRDMRKRLYRLLLLLLTFLVSQTVYAADTKRTIHVATAGTLSNYISEDEKYQIKELTLTGEINGDDLGFLREMSGGIFKGKESEIYFGHGGKGSLSILDISGVRILAGGTYVILVFLGEEFRYETEKDIIPKDAFSGCTVLTSVTLPNSITTIGPEAFRSCSNLTYVTIPNSVTAISDNAFSNCSSLSSVISEIKTPFAIGDYVFDSSYETATLTVPAGTKSKYQSTDGWKQFKNIVEAAGDKVEFTIDGVTYQGSKSKKTALVKAVNTNLNSVEIPSQVSYNGTTYDVIIIGYGAFSDCSGLTSVTIPNSVIEIEGEAFWRCIGLSSITFPNSVTTIREFAFFDCSGLTSVTIGNGLISLGLGAFSGCTNITTITSEIDSPSSFDDSVFSSATYSYATLTVPKGKKSLYQSTAGWSNFKNIVEAGGTQGGKIGDKIYVDGIYYIIKDNNSLSVTYGDIKYTGDVVIPYQVFYNGITYSVISIGDYAFQYCDISSITIPNSVTSIGVCAFDDCGCLTSITIPNNVTSLGPGAFENCYNLVSITSNITIPFEISENVFQIYEAGRDIFSSATLTVPAGTKSAYQATEGWKLFKHIVEAGSGDVGDVFSVDGIYFKIEDNNYVSVTLGDVKYSGDVVIPNQVANNGKTYEVTSIDNHAFFYCSNLSSVTIPNSVNSIDSWAFYYCSGLTSITIPHSVTSIGNYAFFECSGLTSVILEIKAPFAIDDYVFKSYNTDVYATAILTVPAGTKAKYQSTDGWKLFQNIVEVAGDEVEFTIDGVTYQGSKLEKTALVKAVNTSINSVEIPASVSYDGTTYTVTGIADNAFVGCTLAALIWNTDFALPNNAFSNASIGSNFLLYVKSASYAPSTVRNVVVDGKASSITLSDDGGRFYCPRAFTVENISYTHHYSMTTGGNGKGWETIALPYDVQTITHATRGEIVPFAAYSQNSGKKPFWLCKFGSNGFVRTNSIQAYTPYIIAMPNQSSYDNNYILAGDVTFSAENVTVAATPTFSGTFVPTFSTVPKASDVYALNVVNRYVSQTGGYDAGSKFISNLRDVRPFEAYISQASSTRGIYDINMEDGTTSMDGVLSLLDPDREIDIFTLSGQKVKRVRQSDLDVVIDQLPHGVYIVNGQIIIR